MALGTNEPLVLVSFLLTFEESRVYNPLIKSNSITSNCRGKHGLVFVDGNT